MNGKPNIFKMGLGILNFVNIYTSANHRLSVSENQKIISSISRAKLVILWKKRPFQLGVNELGKLENTTKSCIVNP